MIIIYPGTPTVKGVKVPASAKQIERPIAVFGLVFSTQVPRARSLSCAIKLWQEYDFKKANLEENRKSISLSGKSKKLQYTESIDMSIY